MTSIRMLAVVCFVAAISSATTYAKWARLEQNTVQELWEAKPDFHPDVMKRIVECPDYVALNWRKSGDNWIPPKTQEELDRDAFDQLRRSLKTMSGAKARKAMAASLLYQLDGNLDIGYPILSAPLCTNAAGVVLSYSEFVDYIQEVDDSGAPQQEVNALKQRARQVRQYFKSLKGD